MTTKAMIWFLSILLLIALILEGTVTSLPLVLVVLLYLTILQRNATIFPIAFLGGIFLDIFTLRPLGISSLIFIVFVFLILLYQRKYEINSYLFVFFASFWGSLVLLLLTGKSNIFLQSVLTSVMAVVIFVILKIVNKTFVIKQ